LTDYGCSVQAREFQEVAKKEALDVARTMVQSKRCFLFVVQTELCADAFAYTDLHQMTLVLLICTARQYLKPSSWLKRFLRRKVPRQVCLFFYLSTQINAKRISSGKPLKIITGKGAHSVNKVSVLKPAIRRALVEAGWAVSSWDGGLVVRGKCS